MDKLSTAFLSRSCLKESFYWNDAKLPGSIVSASFRSMKSSCGECASAASLSWSFSALLSRKKSSSPLLSLWLSQLLSLSKSLKQNILWENQIRIQIALIADSLRVSLVVLFGFCPKILGGNGDLRIVLCHSENAG